MTNISYQLYSSRHFGPITETMKMISEHGCKEAEGVAGFIVKDDPAETDKALAELKNALDANGMTMPTLHTGVDLLKDHVDTLIKCGKTLGCNTIIVAYLEPNQRPTTADGWRQYAADLKPYAQPLFDAGFDVGWHNHDWEFTPLEGTCAMEQIMLGFPELKLEMDIAWVAEAGVDPLDALKQFSDKVFVLHVKDKAPAGQNEDQDGWCNVGEGVIKWADILAEAKKYPNIKHFILEHDLPKSDVEFASVSAANLRKLLTGAGY